MIMGNKTLWQRIYEWRVANGVSQKQLAELMGVDRAITCRAQKAKEKKCKLQERVERLCSILKCTPNELFGAAEEKRMSLENNEKMKDILKIGRMLKKGRVLIAEFPIGMRVYSAQRDCQFTQKVIGKKTYWTETYGDWHLKKMTYTWELCVLRFQKNQSLTQEIFDDKKATKKIENYLFVDKGKAQWLVEELNSKLKTLDQVISELENENGNDRQAEADGRLESDVDEESYAQKSAEAQ